MFGRAACLCWWGLSEDGVDHARPHGVQQAEVGAGDHDEAQHDAGGLGDGPAIRPLYAAELDDARTEEVDEAVAAPAGRLVAGGRIAAAAPGGADRRLLPRVLLLPPDLVL